MAYITGVYKLRRHTYPGFTYMDNAPIEDREYESIVEVRARAWMFVTTSYPKGVKITSWDIDNRVDAVVATVRMQNGIVVYDENPHYNRSHKPRTYGLHYDGGLYSL